MSDYAHTLGDAVKRARGKSGLTQSEVADAANVDVRTVLNIENYKGNPKMEVLYPLIRVLKIDTKEVFYPEMQRESPALSQLRLLIEDCTEEEAASIIPIFNSVLSVLRERNANNTYFSIGKLVLISKLCSFVLG